MAIERLIEYGRWCDHPDCRHGYANVCHWTTRAQCEEDSAKEGWVRCSRKRWLCPDCAAREFPQATEKQVPQ
jgi:hypothetical protein